MKTADLIPDDIGKLVVYTPRHDAPTEVGKISGWNENYVHVRFSSFDGQGYQSTVKACSPDDLELLQGQI